MAALGVHHLNCGTMCPRASRLLVGRGGLFDPAELVCHCLLVETASSGLVLIDTGIGTHEVRDPRKLPLSFRVACRPRLAAEEPAKTQIERLGYSPEDVRHIVVTHLDPDHAGGIADFPWATVHVHETEYRGAQERDTLGEQTRYVARQWSGHRAWARYDDSGDQWFGFRAIRHLEGLNEDIALVPLFGHSRGHSGVAVRTEHGWYLHAGDAYFYAGELNHPRICPPGLDLFQRVVAFDEEARLDNQDRLRRLYREHGDDLTIFCAHDADELARFTA